MSLTRLQLRDLGLHYQAIAVMCARVAAKRADAGDVASLRRYVHPAPPAGSALPLLDDAIAVHDQLAAESRIRDLIETVGNWLLAAHAAGGE